MLEYAEGEWDGSSEKEDEEDEKESSGIYFAGAHLQI